MALEKNPGRFKIHLMIPHTIMQRSISTRGRKPAKMVFVKKRDPASLASVTAKQINPYTYYLRNSQLTI